MLQLPSGRRLSVPVLGLIAMGVLAILAIALSTIPTGGSNAAPAHSAATHAASGGQPAGAAPRIMVVVMENQNYSDMAANSYLSQLAGRYRTYTNYRAVGHYSEDNYLALIAGRFYPASANDDDPGGSNLYSDETLVNQLDAHRIPWMAYMDGMSGNCARGDGGDNYLVHHDPFVYFSTVTAHDCNHVVPATGMIAALNGQNGPMPAFVFLTPNAVNDMGDNGSVGTGISYLKHELPALQATAWYKSGGHVVLVWDESAQDNAAGPDTSPANQVMAMDISATSSGKVGTALNHYGLLRAIQQAYGLGTLPGQVPATAVPLN